MHLLFSSCFYFFLFLFGFSTVCCDVNRYCFVFILIGVCRIYLKCGLICWFFKKIKFGELYIHYIISLYSSNIFHYITPFSFLSFHDSYIKYIGLLDIVIEAPLIFFSFPFCVSICSFYCLIFKFINLSLCSGHYAKKFTQWIIHFKYCIF